MEEEVGCCRTLHRGPASCPPASPPSPPRSRSEAQASCVSAGPLASLPPSVSTQAPAAAPAAPAPARLWQSSLRFFPAWEPLMAPKHPPRWFPSMVLAASSSHPGLLGEGQCVRQVAVGRACIRPPRSLSLSKQQSSQGMPVPGTTPSGSEQGTPVSQRGALPRGPATYCPCSFPVHTCPVAHAAAVPFPGLEGLLCGHPWEQHRPSAPFPQPPGRPPFSPRVLSSFPSAGDSFRGRLALLLSTPLGTAPGPPQRFLTP